VDLHYGVAQDLEDQAWAILALDRADEDLVTGPIHGILSPHQYELRLRREFSVGLKLGEYLQDGMYRRAYNPLFGRRPGKWWSQTAEPTFDGRIGDVRGASGWTAPWPTRVRGWATEARQGEYHHLTRYQRSRIRNVMRRLPSTAPQVARDILRMHLAVKYGVPPWIIVRVAKRSSV
jgi:hypothetical protein